MIIRYRGGPLNRRTFTGPSQQPKYRDHAGQPITHEHGSKMALAAARHLTRATSYVYNAQQCTYEHISLLIADCETQRTTIEAGSNP